MKKVGKEIVMILFFLFVLTNFGCSHFCTIPNHAKTLAELQAKQAERVNIYLHQIDKKPELFISTNPKLLKLRKDILQASDSLVGSARTLSDFLGKPNKKEEKK